MKKLLKNRWAQIGLALFIGAALGALLYPTKHIEETIKWEYEEELRKTSEKYVGQILELEDKLDEEEKSHLNTQIHMHEEVTKLKYEIKDLQSKKKETYYKIVRPDGTVEIKSFKESEVNESTRVITSIRQEFDQKISQIEDRWKKVHAERVEKLKKSFELKENSYQKKIEQLESKKIVDINPKKYGLEVGYMSNRNYYMHNTMDLFGPFFIGVQTESNFTDEFAIGGGLGIRF